MATYIYVHIYAYYTHMLLKAMDIHGFNQTVMFMELIKDSLKSNGNSKKRAPQGVLVSYIYMYMYMYMYM